MPEGSGHPGGGHASLSALGTAIANFPRFSCAQSRDSNSQPSPPPPLLLGRRQVFFILWIRELFAWKFTDFGVVSVSGKGGEGFIFIAAYFCFLDHRISGAIWRDLRMVCTRKTKTLVSTCVILSGMTNIVCLLYVGWVTNYIASVYVKVQEPISEKKLEEDKGDTLRIIERLDHLENVIKQHIQGTTFPPACSPSSPLSARRSLCAAPSPPAVSVVSVAIGGAVASPEHAGWPEEPSPSPAGQRQSRGALREPPPPKGLGLGLEPPSSPALPSPNRAPPGGSEPIPASHLAVYLFFNFFLFLIYICCFSKWFAASGILVLLPL